MPHSFDAVNKYILSQFPGDWIALGGLPAGVATHIVDADLSVVSKAADKLVRVEAAEPYVAHIEFQSGADNRLDVRVLVYNVLAADQLNLPVRSVVFLLRRPAMPMGVKGKVSWSDGADHRLEFSYKLVKVWELPVDALLAAGLGTLPLAPISAVSEPALPGVIAAMKRRVDAESSGSFAGEFWTATRILMGLRYEDKMVAQLLCGVHDMKESTTYQAILKEGEAQGFERGIERGIDHGIDRGRAREARALLVRVGERRFGALDGATHSRLETIHDIGRLEALFDRVIDNSARDWSDLFGS